jgi:hypothetical protein
MATFGQCDRHVADGNHYVAVAVAVAVVVVVVVLVAVVVATTTMAMMMMTSTTSFNTCVRTTDTETTPYCFSGSTVCYATI